jgi:hypothetical protein
MAHILGCCLGVGPNNGWSGWASMGGWIDIVDVDQNAL